MASVRLTWPNGLAIETVKPRLPDCGMSNIFIRYLLTFFCCFFLAAARVAGNASQVARAKSVFVMRDA
jgi:hypothetical protein